MGRLIDQERGKSVGEANAYQRLVVDRRPHDLSILGYSCNKDTMMMIIMPSFRERNKLPAAEERKVRVARK